MLLLPMIRVVLIMMMMVMILIIIVMIMMVMVIMMSMRRRVRISVIVMTMRLRRRRVRISVIVMMTMRFRYVNCKPSSAVGVVLTGVEVCLPLHRTCFYSFVRTVTIFLLLGCFTVLDLEYHTIAQNLPIQ